MTCQHILFESDRAAVVNEDPGIEILFQPIIDTFERNILAHNCLLPQPPGSLASESRENVEAVRLRSLAIHSASRQSPHGLYFMSLLPSSVDDPEFDMSSTVEAVFEARMHPGNMVFDIAECDLVRDPPHSRRIRDYLRRNGFRLAMSGVGLSAGTSSLDAVSEFQPEYIKLDSRLTRDIGQPASARAISKLVRAAEPASIRVIAEGVDRTRLLENLWLLGVRFVEGRLFGDPADHLVRAATLEFAP